MILSTYIADLLLKNNCVIVPNFGGFIANYKSAVIDEVKGKIYPPSKNVIFNNALTNNDGLLANYVAQKLNLSYQNALLSIDEKATEWKESLSHGERIDIGEIGFLFEESGKIQFEQNRDYNLLLDAYGLSAVQFVQVLDKKEEKPVASQKVVSEKKSIVEPVLRKVETTSQVKEIKPDETTKIVSIDSAKKPKSKVWKKALVACAIPVLFYSYWIPINSNVLESGIVTIEDFNPFTKSVERTYQKIDSKFNPTTIEDETDWSTLTEKIDADIYNYQFSESLYIPVRLKTTEVNNVVETNGHLHLVAGCFSNKSNALNLIDDLKSKGFNAYLIDKNKGLHRVSAGNYSSNSDLQTAKSKLKNYNINSWVLKK